MPSIYKIHNGSQLLVLTHNIGEYTAKHPEAQAYTSFPDPGAEDWQQIFRMLAEGTGSLVAAHASPDVLLRQLTDGFTIIRAGGGLVRNLDEKVLMIFRRGKWDLPKGKLDPGESIEACALREVAEETGLQHIRITRPLTDTWHIYREQEKQVLKQTTWFLMQAEDGTRLTPQAEEDIEKAVWAEPDELMRMTENTYPAIMEVFRSASITK